MQGISTEKRKEEWIKKTRERTGKLFDDTLMSNLFTIYDNLRKDHDWIMVIDGREGKGKSTFGMQIGATVDENFSEKNIAMNFTQFVELIEKAPPYSAVLFDEAGTALFSRESMTKMNILLTKLFMTIRQRNLLIILCIPSFYFIDSYIREARIDCLLHIIQRGDYYAFDDKKCKHLTTNYGKYRTFPFKERSFFGHFNVTTPPQINLQNYRQIKEESMKLQLDEAKAFTAKLDAKNKDVSKIWDTSQAANALGITIKAVHEKIKLGRMRGEKIGGKWYIDPNNWKIP